MAERCRICLLNVRTFANSPTVGAKPYLSAGMASAVETRLSAMSETIVSTLRRSAASGGGESVAGAGCWASRWSGAASRSSVPICVMRMGSAGW